MSKTIVLGLDLGGTNIAAGVVDSSGKLLSSVRAPTPASGVRKDVAALFDAAHSAVAAAGVSWRAVRAVGVGVPGAFESSKAGLRKKVRLKSTKLHDHDRPNRRVHPEQRRLGKSGALRRDHARRKLRGPHPGSLPDARLLFRHVVPPDVPGDQPGPARLRCRGDVALDRTSPCNRGLPADHRARLHAVFRADRNGGGRGRPGLRPWRPRPPRPSDGPPSARG